jgi:hemerythrin-like metal-binding protein
MEYDWSQDLSIGIEQIDNQHKELFQHIASLRSALRKGEGRAALLKTIEFLKEYVDAHFNAEEALMRRHHYHGILEQTKEHEAFRRDFSDFKKKLMALESQGEVTALLAIEFERRLSGWLVDHIGKVDKKLGTFLADTI